jgi:SOS response regulatory protein OraA/RecX
MRTLFTLILCIFVYSGAVQAQSMSDEQIIQYVQQAQLSGKSQQQMATELAAKGVTPEQMQRLKDKYEKSQASTATNQKTTGTNRTREKQP